MAISRGETSASTFAANRSIEHVAQFVAGSFWTVHDSGGQFGVLGTVQCLHAIDAHLRVGVRQANPIELENSSHLRNGKGFFSSSL
jgi:hypothetical protein